MTPDIRAVGEGDYDALVSFFLRLGADDAATARFHPHPFTPEYAQRLCAREGIDRDLYFGAFEGEQMVGYAMLRGWDEGYATPAFGVAVRADCRGRGLGAALLDHAIVAARAAGASDMMLKVYVDNEPARRLYDSRGFMFGDDSSDCEQVVGRLSL